MKRTLSVLIAVCMLACSCALATAETAKYTPGTYTVDSRGMQPMTVKVELSEDAILSIDFIEQSETYGIGTGMPGSPLETIPAWIIENQSLACDAVSGATLTGNAIVNAVAAAVEQAGGDPEALKAKAAEAPAAQDETIECDVVVAGAGAAGLSAGIAAAEAGSRTVILEKLGIPGGSTTRCGGYFLAGGTQMQADQGIEDSADALYDYLKGFGGETADDAKLRAYADASAGTLQWMIDNGAHFESVVSVDTAEEPAREHSTYGNTAMDQCLGGRMTVPLANSFLEKGGTLLCGCAATELVLDDSGSVAGLKAVRRDGSTLTVMAKSVVLATGGYGGDYQRVSQLDGHTMYSGATAGDTGDAEAIVTAVDGKVISDTRGNVTMQSFTCGVGTGEESGLIVTPAGERFINEYCYFYHYIEALLDGGYDFGWYIADAEDPNPMVQYGMTLDSTPHAGSARELAELIGADPDVLDATISRYNELCDAGEDADFGKPMEYMNKLENELYAIQLSASISGTYGGVLTNTESEVLDSSDAAVPGLYAAGEAAFCGLVGENGYPMCGYAVGTAVFFGRTAGANAAAFAAR